MGPVSRTRVPGGDAVLHARGGVALAKVLTGSLPRPTFPEALRRSAPPRWRWEAGFALDHAQAHARRGDHAACIGKCAYAVLAAAHATQAEVGAWVVNEKDLVERAGLQACEEVLRQVASRPGDNAVVGRLREALSDGFAPERRNDADR